MTTEIGLLVFPCIQQLDLAGPYEVFASWPQARVHLIGKSRGAVASSTGLTLTPTATYADCPQLDVICVPGGVGVNALMSDEETLSFICAQAKGARFVTSVCTGALVLGAAGAAARPARHDALGFARSPRRVRRGSGRGARRWRRRVADGRRRHGGKRFRADAHRRTGGPRSGGADPAQSGIRASAAVRRRLARNGAAGDRRARSRTWRRRARQARATGPRSASRERSDASELALASGRPLVLVGAAHGPFTSANAQHQRRRIRALWPFRAEWLLRARIAHDAPLLGRVVWKAHGVLLARRRDALAARPAGRHRFVGRAYAS